MTWAEEAHQRFKRDAILKIAKKQFPQLSQNPVKLEELTNTALKIYLGNYTCKGYVQRIDPEENLIGGNWK